MATRSRSVKTFKCNVRRRYVWDPVLCTLHVRKAQGNRVPTTIGAQCRLLQMPLRLVVRSEAIMVRLIQQNHTRAHDGRDRLATMLGTQFKYTGLIALITRVLKGCTRCKEFHDPLPRVKEAIITWKPFQLVMFDLFKLPMETYDGFLYVILVKDHFTKFHWAEALKGKEAQPLVDFFVTLWQKNPVPERFHCDNGSEFLNNAMKAALDYLDRDHEISSGKPRNPQTQGLIERANKTVKSKILKKVCPCTSWGLHISLNALSTSVHFIAYSFMFFITTICPGMSGGSHVCIFIYMYMYVYIHI